VRSTPVPRVGCAVGHGSGPLWYLRLPARSAPWHIAHVLPSGCARRSRKSPGRHPIRRTQFHNSRPHDTRSRCHGRAMPRGDDHAAPQTLFYGAVRRLDHSGSGITASPSEATPSRQLRDTTLDFEAGDFWVQIESSQGNGNIWDRSLNLSTSGNVANGTILTTLLFAYIGYHERLLDNHQCSHPDCRLVWVHRQLLGMLETALDQTAHLMEGCDEEPNPVRRKPKPNKPSEWP
jgi:hypothetical protein